MVHHFLRDQAARRPDAPAIVDCCQGSTYGEVDRAANRFANLFLSRGAGRGDRVVLALDNSLDLVAGYFGALKAGAVAVPLAPGPSTDRLAQAITDCSPKVCVIDEKAVASLAVQTCLCDLPAVFVRRAPRLRVISPAHAFPDLRTAVDAMDPAASDASGDDEAALAAIIYTSGSTGSPRGVMLTHRNIVANTQSIVSYLALTERDRVMCVLPFSYVYGLSLLHTHFAVGGSVVIDNRFAFPNAVLDAMRQHDVTGFAGVPSTFAVLMYRSKLRQMQFPALRYVTQAGGGMAPSQILEWLNDGPRVPFFVMYGATEASARLTYLPPGELRRKLGSIGRPIPGVMILVVGDDGRPLPTGAVGELVASGENIGLGYWNCPGETRERFGPLGFHTGDLGYSDDEGYLFLVGRRSDMLKVGGRRIAAKAIEEVLYEHPDIHEAAVVAAPDDILGEVPVAVVSVRDDAVADAAPLLALCRRRLAGDEVPARIIFRRELPKLPGVGKLDKSAIRALVAADICAATRTFSPLRR